MSPVPSAAGHPDCGIRPTCPGASSRGEYQQFGGDGEPVVAQNARADLGSEPEARLSKRLKHITLLHGRPIHLTYGASFDTLRVMSEADLLLTTRQLQDLLTVDRITILLQQIASMLSEIGEDRVGLLGRLERIAEISTDVLDDSQGRM